MKLGPKLRRVLIGGVLLLSLLVVLEAGARVYWVARGVPFFSAHKKIQYAFYPELLTIERQRIVKGDPYYDVLLLGGSVLDSDHGSIEHILRERLTDRLRRRVRIHNVSAPAHTSLDSWYKYRHLSDRSFDLVVFYHGINEVRANNCPPSVFREDYSHYSYYDAVNDYERRPGLLWPVLPYTAKHALLALAGRVGLVSYMPTHLPRPQWLEYGSDIKSAASFRTNLTAILELAAEKKETVVLMSFSSYLCKGYNEPSFRSQSLDYLVHWAPVEVWGTPANVAAGVAAHNAIVAELARAYEDVIFVDQANLMPKGRRYFNDICHLTTEGCERFVDNLLQVLPPVH